MKNNENITNPLGIDKNVQDEKVQEFKCAMGDESISLEEIIDKYLLNGIPYVFNGDEYNFFDWSYNIFIFSSYYKNSKMEVIYKYLWRTENQKFDTSIVSRAFYKFIHTI